MVGVREVKVEDAESLIHFFAECFQNRAVSSTKMNDQSSRSHAIYTILLNRTIVEVADGESKVGNIERLHECSGKPNASSGLQGMVQLLSGA